MSLQSTLNFLYQHPLTQSRPLSAIWRFATWQISSRLFPKPRVIPWVGGTKLWIKRGWTGITGNYYAGLHEVNDMAFLLHLLRPGDVFVDVGANMGTYTVLASGVCGAYSYGFEPVSSTFERLQANIKLNQLEQLTTLTKCAVGGQTGELRFTYGEDTTNHVATETEQDIVIVPVKTLDDSLPQTPNLIKIDVEGFETEVLQGALQHLASPDLKAIIIELNGSGARYGYDEQIIHQKLLDLQFKAYTYDPFQRKLQAIAHFGNHNTIYCRDLEWINTRLKEADQIQVLHHRF